MTSLLHRVRDRLQTQLLTLLPAPTPTYPTINSMGQPKSGVSAETIQAVMEWLFASLINAGYYGRSHLYWLQAKPSQHSTEHFSTAIAGESQC
jgi:type VI protein secretion system component VasF